MPFPVTISGDIKETKRGGETGRNVSNINNNNSEERGRTRKKSRQLVIRADPILSRRRSKCFCYDPI